MTNTCECDNASTRFSIVAFSVAANVEFAASIVMSLDLTILCTCRLNVRTWTLVVPVPRTHLRLNVGNVDGDRFQLRLHRLAPILDAANPLVDRIVALAELFQGPVPFRIGQVQFLCHLNNAQRIRQQRVLRVAVITRPIGVVIPAATSAPGSAGCDR